MTRHRMLPPRTRGLVVGAVAASLSLVVSADADANMTFERPAALRAKANATLKARASSASPQVRPPTPSRYADWVAARGPVVPPTANAVGRLHDGTTVFTMKRADVGKIPSSATRLAGEGPWPTGRLHVKLKANASVDVTRAPGAIARDHKLTFVRPFRVTTWMLFDAGPGASLADIYDALRSDPRVELVELDFLRRFDVRDYFDNAFYDSQWHLENTGQSQGFPRDPVVNADVNAPTAWEQTFGSPEVIIAVLDSGQDDTHPDFPPGKIIAPFDALNNIVGTAAPSNGDYEAAHGIACSGLAAAPRDGQVGVVGVCPDCSVMPVRIFATDDFGFDTASADAFVHILENDAAISSNSWGYGDAGAPPALVREAIEAYTNLGRGGLGGVTVFAIGNTSNLATPFEIALDPNVLAVGGTGFDDLRVAYSTFHPQIDVVAPTGHDFDEDAQMYEGAGLVTTDRPGQEGYNPTLDEIIAAGQVNDDDYTAIMSGTSGACPIAAGIAGLILSMEPSLSYAQVFRLLTDSAAKVGPIPYDERGHNQEYGFGRVDAAAALALLANNELCVPSAEVCDDNVDNDCDLSIDGEDPDCGFVPPLPDIPYGRVCLGDEECGDGFCAPFNPDSSDGICTAACFGQTCGDDGVCTIFSDGFNEIGLCMRSCAVGCLAGTQCASVPGDDICLQPCEEFSFCPAETECFEPGNVCGGEPGPEPEPFPEPIPEPFEPDVFPGVDPEPSQPEPDGVEPDGVEPDDEPEGIQPRRRPGRIRIAAVSNCNQTGDSVPPLLALMVGALWFARRRRSVKRSAS